MRGAAARLGLGIARDLKKQHPHTHPFPHIKKGSSCSATATATEENKKGGTGSDKSLYLYFTELIGRQYAHGRYFSGLRYPIRSIKLSYLLSPSSSSSIKVTEAVHTLKRTDRFRNWGCGPYGSQILLISAEPEATNLK
ncbi:hypothetical protein M0R45_007324 [Rubus argutus]|uniref:Uncharacterized protein n=1 Tax=Rubus argutus TaxID=59490 RepID=A0AAW1XXZ5_RUBAR